MGFSGAEPLSRRGVQRGLAEKAPLALGGAGGWEKSPASMVLLFLKKNLLGGARPRSFKNTAVSVNVVADFFHPGHLLGAEGTQIQDPQVLAHFLQIFGPAQGHVHGRMR
jgi:hypothetical protein